MQSSAIHPGWAGWVFTSPTQILKNHVWLFSAALRMARLEKNSIKVHLNQDIKIPICSLKAPLKFLWLMPADGYVADDPSQRYSGHGDSHWPDAGNSCVETTVGSLLCEAPAAPTQTLTGEWEGNALWFKRPLSMNCVIIFALTMKHRAVCLQRPSPLPRYNRGRLSRSPGILPNWKYLTRKQLCLPRPPELPGASSEIPTAPQDSPPWREVNKSPMATAMKNNSPPLKTGKLKQLERENYFQCQHCFGFPGTQKW